MATVFCTPSDVKVQAPIAAGVVSRFDQMIPLYIASVSQQIRSYCNRKFDYKEYTEYRMSPDTFNSQENYRFRLTEWPVVEGSVFIDYDPRGQFIPNISSISELAENVDFVLDYETGWVDVISYGLFYQPRGLRIFYIAGYTENAGVLDVPDELRAACALQVSFILDRIAAAQTGQSQEKGNRGGNSHTFATNGQNGLTAETIALIREYRNPILGRT